jgi:ribosomal protein S12 methylthiotransferase accessory factor
MDLGIPVLLGVLRDRRNPALLLLDMVSHLDPRARLDKLYRELAQFLFPYLVDREHFVRPCTRDPDPASVMTFPDHVAFHQSAEKNRHAAFLTSAATSRRFADDAHAAIAREPQAELDGLVARLATRGYHTIVVDCTLPLLRDLGLFAVKVLIPGLQPLNCGHRLRVLGGERVLTIAQRMGLATGRRSLTELNPLPHPFW